MSTDDRRTFIAELASMLSVADVPTSTRAVRIPATVLRGVWVESEQFSPDPVKGKGQIRATVQRPVDAHLELVLAWATRGNLVGSANPPPSRILWVT